MKRQTPNHLGIIALTSQKAWYAHRSIPRFHGRMQRTWELLGDPRKENHYSGCKQHKRFQRDGKKLYSDMQ